MNDTHIIQNGSLEQGHGYLYCDKCGGTGVTRVSLFDWKRCSCQGEHMAVNLVLDKCCKVLNHALCCSSPKLESYTLSWNEGAHYWMFALRIRGQVKIELIQLCHRTMVENSDDMVASFTHMLWEVLR